MQFACKLLWQFCIFTFGFINVCCAAPAVISGTGSSASEPVYASWAKGYEAASGTKLNYVAAGSTAGLNQIKARSVDFGASDFALSAEESKKDGLVCFPTAISGIVPVINLPGIRTNELNLTGPVLADIFARKIKQWSDPAIQELNSQIKLPNLPITLVVR